MLLQNLECVIVEGCGRTITATGLSLLANCRRLHTLCITTTATKPHIGTQSLSALTCLHTLALHVQSGDRTIAAAEVLAVSDMNHPLPAGLDALTMLTSLCLSGWTHAMLLPTAISLQNCSIMSLPDSLQQLTDLESLNLHMNDMGRYPHLVLKFGNMLCCRLKQLIMMLVATSLLCEPAGILCCSIRLLALTLTFLGARTNHSTACHTPRS